MTEPLQFGSSGLAVERLQRNLVVNGYRVSDPTGHFLATTHNAVLALQARAGLPITGIADAAEREAADRLVGHGAPMPDPVLPAEIPFIEARFWKRAAAPRAVVDLIVIHSMEAPEASTRAERCAQYMAELPADLPPKNWKSAHYFFDCGSCVQGVRDECIAYHAPGVNPRAIGLEHAGYARQTATEWLDSFSRPMLILSALKSAQLVAKYSLPIEYVDADGIIAGKRGFTEHRQVTRAYPARGTHQDPGESFPMDWYLDRVRAALRVAS